jgi:hypothetical protein
MNHIQLALIQRIHCFPTWLNDYLKSIQRYQVMLKIQDNHQDP